MERIKNTILVISCLSVSLFYSQNKTGEIVGLTSMIQLQPEPVTVDLDDYFSLSGEITVVKVPDGLTAKRDGNFLILSGIPAQSVTALIVEKNQMKYAIPVRKTEKIPFSYAVTPIKEYKNLKIKGTFNNWNVDNTPLKFKNGKYTFQTFLNPGTYEYCLVEDGKDFSDPENPKKLGNNSLFTVGNPDAKKPFIFGKQINDNQLIIESSDKNVKYLVLIDNFLLDSQYQKNTNGKLTITLPVNELKDKNRTWLRIYGFNKDQVSNDMLIPLEKGKIILNTNELNRRDQQTMILYSLMVDRFNDADKSNDEPLNSHEVLPLNDYNGGDLKGITEKIKSGFFTDLGINTLWISPLHQNPYGAYGLYDDGKTKTKFTGYHGYWPVALTKIDSRFGTDLDFKELLDEAHKRNFNVLIDYVANHVHEKNPMLKQHPDWVTPLLLPDGTKNLRMWDEHRLTTWFDEFIPTLDLEKPEAANAMSDSVVYWVKKFNIDGFRHDAVKHIPNSFWRLATKKVKNEVLIPENRPLYQIGETYGDYELISSYINNGMLNAQFEFNLYDKIRNLLIERNSNFSDLKDALRQSWYYFGAHNVMGNVTGNHDKGRVVSYFDGSLSLSENESEAGYDRRIENKSKDGFRISAQLISFIMAVPGVPVIYYGDEIGMPGGGDPDSRRMMFFDNYNADETWLQDITTKLTHLRTSKMSLLYGDSQILPTDDNTLGVLRTYFGDTSIYLMNKENEKKEIKIILPKNIDYSKMKSHFGQDFNITNNVLTVTLQPFAFEFITK
ncbi:MAG: alpha-amylase [Flavobacteriaceae bacterium]|jgi:glycosidase|nr:alpha-amylase [Flavobacteriaceae bacterium]